MYAPTTLGNQSGVLTISSNDAKTPVLEIGLDGTGVQPLMNLSMLPDNAVTPTSTINVAGRINGGGGDLKSLTIDGQAAIVSADGSFSLPSYLALGANTIMTVATDKDGNHTTDIRTIILDQTTPPLTITTPADNSESNVPFVVLSGILQAEASITQKVNNSAPEAVAILDQKFDSIIYLNPGVNTVEIIATDHTGKSTSQKRTIVYDAGKPSIAITEPAQDITTDENSVILQGVVTDALTAVTITVSVDGQAVTPADVADGTFAVPLNFNSKKIHQIMVTATDEDGNSASAQRNIIYGTPLTVVDAMKALRFATGIEAPTAEELARADLAPVIDGVSQPDGIIDIRDVVLILRRAIGLPL